MIAKIAQLAEHVIGNDEVPGSIPGLGFCPRPAPYEIVKQFLYGAQKSASPFSSVAEQWFRKPQTSVRFWHGALAMAGGAMLSQSKGREF